MKVRIKQTPREREIDGVRLDGLSRGMVKDIAGSLAAWLIAEGYADVEMRANREEQHLFGRVSSPPSSVDDRRRRATDR